MTYRPIAYNLFCSVHGALETTPRGVERIDFGYSSYLFENWPADCFGVLPTVLGLRFFPRDQILRGRDLLAKMWGEARDSDADPAFRDLQARYEDPGITIARRRKNRDPLNLAGVGRVLQLLFNDGVHFGRPISAMPRDTIYIDIGHNGLTMPVMLNWLDKRPDVSPVFMVHDTIPLEFPEIVRARSVITHRRIVAATARYARAVIVPTQAAGRAVHLELERCGAPDIPIHAVNLPIDDVFQSGAGLDAPFGQHPYFLACGVIESRKNPHLLLNVWRDLVRQKGEAAPRLIFAGRPGYGSTETMDQIQRSDLLRRHVFVAPGLSTPSIARLMKGARAVLMPSFAEGFGLPPIEALSLGTPAILSDIGAHRDAAGDFGVFIDPIDGLGWRARIEAMTTDTDDYLAWKRHIAQFRPYDWPRYMGEITEILRTIS